MSAAALASRASSVRQVDAVSQMSTLFDDAVNVVVLRRTLPAAIHAEAGALLHDIYTHVVAAVAPNSRGRATLAQLVPGYPRLVDDLHFWVEVLSELTGCERCGLRLTRLESAMCPRLHVDRVSVRLVTTFVGAATEYVDHHDVDRRWLGHADDERRGLLRPAARVQRAAEGDVLLLKGEGWPDNVGRGAVHRSPRADPHTPRLLLTLDPL